MASPVGQIQDSWLFTVLMGIVLTLSTTWCGFCVEAASWSYSGLSTPVDWPKDFVTMCGGYWQSPINLDYGAALYSKELLPIKIYSKSTGQNSSITVTNNGHTINLKFPEGMWRVNYNNQEDDAYTVYSLHFHWGSINSQGSEHTQNTRQYPMEGHIVTYRTQMYANFSVAASAPQGLAVLGFFFTLSDLNIKITATSLSQMSGLLTLLKSIPEINQNAQIDSFDLAALFAQMPNNGKYFRYPGSLTTPPCTENVMWTVFADPIVITQEELNIFRQQKFSTSETKATMVDNFRPVQPLNPANTARLQRALLRSWNSGPARPTNVAILVFSMATLTLGFVRKTHVFFLGK